MGNQDSLTGKMARRSFNCLLNILRLCKSRKIFVSFFIFLFIFLNLLPGGFSRDTVDIGHFFSSIHMFEYDFFHHFQFGVNIIDNVGPYGYLHYPYVYTGGVFWAKTIWFTIICIVYAFYATLFFERISFLSDRLLFIFLAIYFPLEVMSPWFSFEIIPRLAILFSAIYLLPNSTREVVWGERFHVIFIGFFYSFLTLEKASNVYFLLIIIFILSVYWFSVRRWRNIASLISVYILGIVIFWIAAGQHLFNIPIYLKSMMFFIDSYQESLGQDLGKINLRYSFIFSGFVIIVIAIRLAYSFFSDQRKTHHVPVELFRTILIGSLYFLVWKQGVLRGTTSYGTFLFTLPILFAYLFIYPIYQNSNKRSDSSGKFFVFQFFKNHTRYIFLFILFIIWLNVVSYKREIDHNENILKEFSSRISMLIHYHPVKKIQELKAKLKTLKVENELPLSLKSAIRSKSVDEFGHSPEILLLNNLNYHPRPVPIDFIVGNDYLNKKNGYYYQSSLTAPDFLFIEDFDFRMTDTRAYLSLLLNYGGIQRFKNYLVMKKRSDWHRYEFQKLEKKSVHFNEWIPLNKYQKIFLWTEIDIEHSIIGKLKEFFFKPNFITLEIMFDDNTLHDFPISIEQFHSGFLISPIIHKKTNIIMHFYDRTEIPWSFVKSFRLLGSPSEDSLFKKQFIVKYYEILISKSNDYNAASLNISNANSIIKLLDPDFLINKSIFPIDFFDEKKIKYYDSIGLSGLENNSRERWRWATGPETKIGFYVNPSLPNRARKLRLNFVFKKGPTENQIVTIRFNGAFVRRFSRDEINHEIQVKSVTILTAKAGKNVLEFIYSDWNHRRSGYGTNDPRKLAVAVMQLSLTQKCKSYQIKNRGTVCTL